MAIPSKWLVCLDPDQAKEMIEVLSHQNMVANRIKEILEMSLKSLEDAEESEKNFLAPEWVPRQAYFLGRKKEIKQLLKLFNFY